MDADTLERILTMRVGQLHASLGDVRSEGLSSARQTTIDSPTEFCVHVDFRGGLSDADLANRVSLFIANIACLGDHLLEWCRTFGKPYHGKALIDSDRDVGIIHDLWLRDKHCDPHTSRSQLWPSLVDITRSAEFAAPPGEGWSGFTIHPTRGLQTFGTGTIATCVNATVVDRYGSRIDNLMAIAARAIERWERLLSDAGISKPPAK